MEKQPVNNGLLLLANEEFEKEKGGYESDEPEEALLENVEDPSVSNLKKIRKRKSADKLQHSKYVFCFVPCDFNSSVHRIVMLIFFALIYSVLGRRNNVLMLLGTHLMMLGQISL